MNTIHDNTPLTVTIDFPQGVNGEQIIKVEYSRIDRTSGKAVLVKESTSLSNILLALNIRLRDGQTAGELLAIPKSFKFTKRISNRDLLLAWLGVTSNTGVDNGPSKSKTKKPHGKP